MLLEATFATGGQVWASRIEAIRGCNATANSKYRMRLGRSVELSSTFRRLPNTPGGVSGKQAERTIQPNTPPRSHHWGSTCPGARIVGRLGNGPLLGPSLGPLLGLPLGPCPSEPLLGPSLRPLLGPLGPALVGPFPSAQVGPWALVGPFP
jgi:hypothetical protein